MTDVYAIGGKDFNGRCQRRFRQRVGIHAHVERAVNALLAPVLDHRLANRQDVVFVKLVVERTAAMAGRAKSHLLRQRRSGRVCGCSRRK
jgi:hypothetical protein